MVTLKKFKLFNIGIIVLVMAFSLAACTNSDSGLEGYKDEAKTALEIYAINKGQTNYTEDNWVLVNAAVATGKDAITVATDTAGVDTAVEAARLEINKVGIMGLDEFIDESDIEGYYGIYNDCVVINRKRWTFEHDIIDDIIEGSLFIYLLGDIMVLKDGAIYHFQNACDQGFFTKEDLADIAACHRERHPEYYTGEYVTPITTGTYKTQQGQYQLGENIKIEEMTVTFCKISEEEFASADHNVVPDVNYSMSDMDYLSFNMSIKLFEEDPKTCYILITSQIYETLPSAYIFEVTFPKDEENITIFAQIKGWNCNQVQLILSTDVENQLVEICLGLS